LANHVQIFEVQQFLLTPFLMMMDFLSKGIKYLEVFKMWIEKE